MHVHMGGTAPAPRRRGLGPRACVTGEAPRRPPYPARRGASCQSDSCCGTHVPIVAARPGAPPRCATKRAPGRRPRAPEILASAGAPPMPALHGVWRRPPYRTPAPQPIHVLLPMRLQACHATPRCIQCTLPSLPHARCADEVTDGIPPPMPKMSDMCQAALLDPDGLLVSCVHARTYIHRDTNSTHSSIDAWRRASERMSTGLSAFASPTNTTYGARTRTAADDLIPAGGVEHSFVATADEEGSAGRAPASKQSDEVGVSTVAPARLVMTASAGAP